MLRGFFFLSFFRCSFFLAAFFVSCFSAMIRSLVAYDLKSGFSVKPFLRRITSSFSCRIQLLLRIAIRPPPRTARDPWDSPPPRNCPVVFIRHVDRSSFDGFLPAVSSLPLSLHLYISRSKRICQQVFYFLVKFFPYYHCGPARKRNTAFCRALRR